ncbi:MAG: DUF58 domain-containing protein [Spirochaetales bacterium]|jgi:uncharacterized protein (DUF58 family)|nr:DUF58 domain-containing protein [Spirochaetales bacterium]
MPQKLFDSEFMQKLEYLTFISRKIFRGRARGQHQTYRKGSSLEFHDFRSYQPGDDFRYIDWSIYSRLDKLFVKLFAAEEDLMVQILIDRSGSMESGTPWKLAYAKKVAAALSYIALLNLDRVGGAAFATEIGPVLPPFRRRGANSIFEFYENITAEGETGFSKALTSFSSASKRPGLAIVISDLLDPDGYKDGLLSLLYNKYDVILIQVLSEEEIDPPIKGAYEFADAETGRKLKVTLEPPVIEAYRNRLTEYLRDIETFCISHSVEYIRSSTLVPFEDLVLKYLRQGMYLH